MSQDAPADIDEAVTELYRGAPEAFVAGRDLLARALRADKRRDEAAAIAKLRRPSRLAWAFNAARAADGQMAAHLDDAVAAVTAAQEGDGNIRQASADLRAAVGELVDTAARTAEAAGHHLDRSTLTPAALAVVGDPAALDDLQAGRLGDVPEGGGFGFGLELPAEPAARSDRKRAGTGRAGEAAAQAGGARDRKAAAPGTGRRGGRRGADRADRADATDRADDEADDGPSPEEWAAARAAVEDAEGEQAEAAEAVDVAERAVSDAVEAVAEAEELRAAAERAVAEAEERRAAAEEALAAARTRQRGTGEAVASARAALSRLGA